MTERMARWPVWLVLLLLVWTGVFNSNLAAQTDEDAVTIPAPSYSVSIPPAHPLTPTSAVFDVEALRLYNVLKISPDAQTVRTDSIRNVVTKRARDWFVAFGSQSHQPLYFDDVGRLAILAGQDSLAQQYIAKRLAHTSLSVLDSGYTLLVAVRSFADTANPARIAIAERYLSMLSHLSPDSVGMWIYQGQLSLIKVYEALGRKDDVLKSGLTALKLVGRMPYVDRDAAYFDPQLYLMVVHALAETANSQKRIDSLASLMESSTIPPRSLITQDSSIFRIAEARLKAFHEIAKISSILTKQAPAVQATVLWNTRASAAPLAATLSTRTVSPKLYFGDGVVRLVMFGNINCCVDEIVAINRLKGSMPSGVEAVYVTSTTGYWGFMPVTTSEERERLRRVYIDTLKITIPIAVWAGEKQVLPNGSVLPAPSPNLESFHVPGNRSFYALAVDGSGVVRRVFYHPNRSLNRADEAYMLDFLKRLAH